MVPTVIAVEVSPDQEGCTVDAWSQPRAEYDDVENWRLLQEVIEERAEWWAEAEPAEE